ncbi:MAG: SPOR domain-containing protein [Gemmatimonadaceae bacterium]
MRSLVSRTAIVLSAACCFITETSAAQSAGVIALPATDSIFRRARRLVTDGNGLAGRALVDSMLRVSPEGTPPHGDALFWRGALAETAAAAERDYRRVVVEYALSPYVDDALLSLAELEQARGDRTAAFQHLQRFVREHPASPARARAGLAAARLAFEQRDVARGCTMIADARTSAGTSDVELRNQIEYYGARCPVAPAASASATTVVSGASPAPITTTTPRAPTLADESKPKSPAASGASNAAAAPTKPAVKPAVKPAAKPAPAVVESSPPKTSTAVATTAVPATSRGTWTIQLAAYNTRPDAERLVKKLAERGVKARISGEAKPFRVRLTFFPTHQAATDEVGELKQRGIIGFVTEEAGPRGAPSP